jgi:hypothetical protein
LAHLARTDVDVTGAGRGFVVTDVVHVGVAELAHLAMAPTAHGARLEHGARMKSTGGDLRHFPADVDVTGSRRRGDANGVWIATLAGRVVAPTRRRARVTPFATAARPNQGVHHTWPVFMLH